ncbi:MAG: hypothetical protein KUG77_25690, partial [Nannocystaceae bacterium]|nr:hypothetical protein [Nannocystaceae bacterium]
MRAFRAVLICSVLASGCDSANKPATESKPTPAAKAEAKPDKPGADAAKLGAVKAEPRMADAEQVGGEAKAEDFEYFAEQVADLRILRYQVPGFESLSVKEKKLVYFLSQAALAGRDIIWDQKYRHNLAVRRTLEAVMTASKADKSSEDWKKLVEYTKRVWFSNGIHHHYSNKKLVPGFSKEFFAEAVKGIDSSSLPLADGEDVDALLAKLEPV